MKNLFEASLAKLWMEFLGEFLVDFFQYFLGKFLKELREVLQEVFHERDSEIILKKKIFEEFSSGFVVTSLT